MNLDPFLHCNAVKVINQLNILHTVRTGPAILLWHFPGLESPGKRLLVLESSGNGLKIQVHVKNMKFMADSKKN